jgi:hypothetical protein
MVDHQSIFICAIRKRTVRDASVYGFLWRILAFEEKKRAVMQGVSNKNA